MCKCTQTRWNKSCLNKWFLASGGGILHGGGHVGSWLILFDHRTKTTISFKFNEVK